jgi:PAS domain S-box-containing protein/diguanylate cyclase (GGDEF)-like protein
MYTKMTSEDSSPSPSRIRFRRLIEIASSARAWVGAIIVLTLCYLFLHVVPMIRRDLGMLRDLQQVDGQGITYESELQYQMQESRRRFLHILLESSDQAAHTKDLNSLRQIDASVGATIMKIDELGVVSPKVQGQVRQSWQDYLTLRDRMLAAPAGAASLAQPGAGARQVEPELGRNAFLAALQSVRNAEVAFQDSAALKTETVTASLHQDLREVLIFCAAKILVLGWILWLDRRRLGAESRLQNVNAKLRLSEDRFRKAYESASVGMGMISLDGTVLSANPMAASILGCDVKEIVGAKVANIMAPECVDEVERRFDGHAVKREDSYQVERRVVRKDGTIAWVRNSVTLMRPEGQEPHYFSISQDITDEKLANDRLAFLANFDPITSLPNRHHFETQLEQRLESSGSPDSGVALLYLEIDSFDFLKGTFGRKVADEVLSELGVVLTAWRREDEVVGRLDDYVFGVLVKAAAYDEGALNRAAELRDLFHTSSSSGQHRIPISASIGIAYSDPSVGGSQLQRTGSTRVGMTKTRAANAADTLMKYARAAMLEARSRGGDSIYLADPGLQERAAQRHQIESALLNGLREDEFRVVFQPQFQVATGKLVRFEALCRWTSKELGPIPPDRFIPIAEQTGLITEIGRRILLEALQQAKTWTDSGRSIGVAVNISPMQFMRPDFTAAITEALAISNFPPALLELEITEGIFIRDLNLAVARIRELQRLGLSIALDDFGTGYSSLSYLQRMPIDAVKLDRSFVSDLTTDPATVSMVKSVLSMAAALNLRVVTEGVETEEQMDILRSLGCEEAQGYLLGRPESSEMALKRVMESPMHPVGTLA